MKLKKILSIIVVFVMTITLALPYSTAFAAGSKGGSGSGTSSRGHYGSGGSGGSGSEVQHPGTGDNGGEEGDSGEEKDGSNSKGGEHKGGISKSGSGASGKGSKKGGRDSSTEGQIAVQVTVTSDTGEKLAGVPVSFKKVSETAPDGPTYTVNTNSSGIASKSFEAGDSCQIWGGDFPGYIAPENTVEVQLTGQEKTKYAELKYTKGDIAVESVTLNTDKLDLISGFSGTLTATVLPANAEHRTVTWNSGNKSVATVSEGKVAALALGKAVITATAEGKSDTCEVTVKSITGIQALSEVDIPINQAYNLPANVTVNLNDLTTAVLPVTWSLESCEDESGTAFLPENPLSGQYFQPARGGFYTFVGELKGWAYDNFKASLVIHAAGGQIVPVTGIALQDESGASISTLSMFAGSNNKVQAAITPGDASNKEVVWASSDTSILTIEPEMVEGVPTGKQIITAVAPGVAVITATALGGVGADGRLISANCTVNVATAPALALIYAAKFDDLNNNALIDEGEMLANTDFDFAEDVYIDVANLVGQGKAGHFYIKIEQKGSAPVVGNGEIDIANTTKFFRLVDALQNFNPVESNNNEYFVSMSTDSRYPKDDEKTLKTNFRIGDATPTIDPNTNIKVTASVFENARNTEGIIFLMCRELDIDASLISWTDYMNPLVYNIPARYDAGEKKITILGGENGPDNLGNLIKLHPDAFFSQYSQYRNVNGNYVIPTDLGNINLFADEAKMFGEAGSDGAVSWFPTTETLKIGGYILLAITPEGYRDNLHSYNTSAEDGSLLDEISLQRDAVIVRNVLFTKQ